ncbi:MAG: cystathionine beta-lyase [Alphaproteobacteria bacterium]|nr:cystathionine beta-lyase [Alphaproteobacteria bacterium]
MSNKNHRPDTQVVHGGQNRKRNAGIVNTPVFHASTVVFDSTAQMLDAHERTIKKGEKHLFYGRRGTPTHWTLQEAITELEGGADTFLTPSGLSACTTAIIGCVKAGDHVLMVDSVYEPTRSFCQGLLKSFGVETTYYDPLIGGELAALMRPNTKLVFCESPGSHTFEMQDLPAIAAAAHKGGALVAVDNTWASPLFCQPLKLGCDISIQAATKYVVGHSDALLGTICVNDAALPGINKAISQLGMAVGPDDAYLATRGFRTLSVRLRQHEKNAMAVAAWLQKRPEVKRVLFPALPDDPGHALWKRDCSGASGLMGIVFHRTSPAAVAAMIDTLKLFPLGYSWGGFESLACPSSAGKARTARPWTEPMPGVRIHVGLEDSDDLIADLEQALGHFNRALG